MSDAKRLDVWVERQSSKIVQKKKKKLTRVAVATNHLVSMVTMSAARVLLRPKARTRACRGNQLGNMGLSPPNQPTRHGPSRQLMAVVGSPVIRMIDTADGGV